MRAVVLKTEGIRAAVLDGNGSVRIIENKDYSRGQVIDIAAMEYPLEDLSLTGGNEGRRRGSILRFNRFLTRHAAQAAAVLAVVLLAGSMSVYAAPVKTAISDSTPSLSYHMNVFDRVVKVEARDDTGREALDHIRPRVAGKRFDKAVDIALTALEETPPGKPEDMREDIREEVPVPEAGDVEPFVITEPAQDIEDIPAEPEAPENGDSHVFDMEEPNDDEGHSGPSDKDSDIQMLRPENEPEPSGADRIEGSKGSGAGSPDKPDLSDSGSGAKEQGPTTSPVEAAPKAPDINVPEINDINSAQPDMYSIFGQGTESIEQGSPDGGFAAEQPDGYGDWGGDGGDASAPEPSEGPSEHEGSGHEIPGHNGGGPGNDAPGGGGHGGDRPAR